MKTHRSIRRHLWIGAGTVLLLVAGGGGWAALTEISGAVIAPGVLVVKSRVQEVQHPSGGVVADILADDGDEVKAGDVLIRLDSTVTRANLAIVTKSIDELTARKARLLAELDDAAAIAFPRELTDRNQDSNVAQLIANERRLFDVRRTARAGQKNQLMERINQLGKESEGYTVQIGATAKEVSFIKRELEGAHTLWEKNLMPVSKLTEIERNATRIEGQRGQYLATLAQTHGKIAETKLQILQVDLDFASDAGTQLREIEAKLGELAERKIAAEDQLLRLEVRAPQKGVVHESIVHTTGGVVPPEKPLMMIVPSGRELSLEVRVSPTDIDAIRLGQIATIQFSSFSGRTTPEIEGVVKRIAPDVSTDPRSDENYYTAEISVPAEEISRFGSTKLVPGMPAEVFIRLENRTVLSYLIQPLRDQVIRAFRES